MKDTIGMPINLFFLKNPSGELEVSFNGQTMTRDWLIKAKVLLDKTLKEFTPKEEQRYNNEVNKYLKNINNIQTNENKRTSFRDRGC
jgi:hypothetical protein